MKKFQQKQIIKSRLHSAPMIIFLLIILFFSINGSKKIWTKYLDSRENAIKTNRELAELQKREKSLKEETSRLNSEEGVEEEIREKFNVLRPGESVLIVKEEVVASTTPKANFWTKIKNMF